MTRSSVRQTGIIGGFVLAALLVPLSGGGCPFGVPVPVDPVITPVAAYGAAGFVATVGDTVPLEGRFSSGEAPFTFLWLQFAGPAATITNADQQDASFVPLAAGKYQFRFTVTDANGASTTVDSAIITVGDIQFVVPAEQSEFNDDSDTDDGYFGVPGDDIGIVSDGSNPTHSRPFVIKPGNPATVSANWSAPGSGDFRHIQDMETRLSIFDPDFMDGSQTLMQVHYTLVSVPSAARETDVDIDRSFDSLPSQGAGNNDFANQGAGAPVNTSLNKGPNLNIMANPDGEFSTLTNIGSLLDNFGILVPGTYVFRATVSNPDGVVRFRDLTVNVVNSSGSGTFGGVLAGIDAVAVVTLPAGSPGNATDKVMTAGQTATMRVAVFPATSTSYRFYLRDQNNIAHTTPITQSVTGQVAATGGTTEIDLTINTTGLEPATYELRVETFDDLGRRADLEVGVNPAATAAALSGTPVRFHVTNDFYAASSINAVNVGSASNAAPPAAPVPYEGWSGPANGGYGQFNALADINDDGAMDILTAGAGGANFNYSTAGFVDGSPAALQHPDNSGHYGPALPAPIPSVATGATPTQIVAGDLNDDDLPDVAVSYVAAGPVGTVQVFFHTGNTANPYSSAADQTLIISPPNYDADNSGVSTQDGNDRMYRNTATNDVSQAPTIATTDPAQLALPDEFGTRIAMVDFTAVGGGAPDGVLDLIITDPGFTSMKVYDPAGPLAASTGTPETLAGGIADFYAAREGRVYVFAGGATGRLVPGRPDIVACDYTEVGLESATEPVDVEVSETDVQYTAVFTGNDFDQIGQSLATGSFSTGSAEAIGNGRPFVIIEYLDTAANVADGDTLSTSFGVVVGNERVYEFDTNGLTVPGNVVVDVSAANATEPAAARAALITAIDNDSGSRLVDAAENTDPSTNGQQIILTSRFSSLDQVVRGAAGATWVGVGGITVSGVAFNMDGVVYRQANAAASGTLATATAVFGTLNSSMGLGATLAQGDLNGSGGNDDLVIGALDSGDALGENDGVAATGDGVTAGDDGAVFVVLDGSTTLPAAVSGVGDNTLGQSAEITNTSVGTTVAVGDVNGDGLDEVFFTEPGFDHIYMIKGAATVSSSPNLTISGVVFTPAGPSLGATGTFLFGDINGDTHSDWVFLNGVNLGFAGFTR